MKTQHIIIFISLILFSCADDDPVLEPIEIMIVTNLHAPTTSAPGQPPAGDFVKFSFEKQKLFKISRIRNWLTGTLHFEQLQF